MFLKSLFLLIFFYSNILALETVKIGILANRSHDISMEKWSDTAEYLTQKIDGFEFVVVPLSFTQLQERVKDKSIDFLLTNTMYYVELEHRYGISRIATLKNISYSDAVVTSYGGVIFTKVHSGIENLNQLKGKRFGAVDAHSFGGWVMVQKELKDANIRVEDFAEFNFLGTHDAVIMAIKDGTVDAGAMRTDTFERMVKEGLINPKNYRVLASKNYQGFPFKVSTTLYPEWPFSKLSSTSQILANKVLIALLEMPADSKAALSANIAGWTIALDYSKVLNLLEELHLGPFSKLSKINLFQIYEKYERWIHFIGLLFICITFALIYILVLNKQLKSKKIEIQELNANLEQKIRERTKKLKHMYSHEKYLKNILSTITDINELLIASFSIQSILKNSIERLAEHNNYNLVLIGLVKENGVEILAQSDDNIIVFEHSNWDFQNKKENFIDVSIQKVLKENSKIISTLPQEYSLDINDLSYSCPLCNLIVLPLGKNEKDEVAGVLSIISKNRDGFELEEIRMLENLAMDIGMSLQTIKQKSILDAMELQKVSNYEETILAFVNIIEQRDSYTAGHTLRVAKYCRLIAESLHLDEEEIKKLEKAAVLHDIGKVVTPDAILLKPGKLNSLEYELIKQHAEAGYRMLRKIDMYKDLAEIIRYHHVRYDGHGYPATSPDNPDKIPLLSYIMSIADAFDAMTSNRIYKQKKSVLDAIQEIKDCKGTQFHPDLVDAAVAALKNVVLDENTTQLPSSELEERRFSYFFLDSLTDVYNENYLKLILLENEKRYKSLNLIEIAKFSDYNKVAGWNAGNEFLQDFALELKTKFSDGILFRYQGDDFVLLFLQERVISQDEILGLKVFKNKNLKVDVTYYDLEQGVPNL